MDPEKKIFKGILPYMGMVAIWVMTQMWQISFRPPTG